MVIFEIIFYLLCLPFLLVTRKEEKQKMADRRKSYTGGKEVRVYRPETKEVAKEEIQRGKKMVAKQV